MPPRQPSQLDLDMARLADGDREAFSAVFRALWPVLVPFCQRALGSGADVDDAAQLTLEKIFGRASDYDPSRPALPWALTIATWECATLRRRRQRARTQDSADVGAAPSQAPSPEDQTLAKELEVALRATLEELPPPRSRDPRRRVLRRDPARGFEPCVSQAQGAGDLPPSQPMEEAP